MPRGRWCSPSTPPCRATSPSPSTTTARRSCSSCGRSTSSRIRAVLDAPGGPKTYEFEKVKAEKPTDPESWKVTRVGGASHTRRRRGDGRPAGQAGGAQGGVVRRRQDQDRPRQAGAGRQRQLRRRQVRARALRPGGRGGVWLARGRSRHRQDRQGLDGRRHAGVRPGGDAAGEPPRTGRREDRARRSDRPRRAPVRCRRDDRRARRRLLRGQAAWRCRRADAARSHRQPRPSRTTAPRPARHLLGAHRRSRLVVGCRAFAQARRDALQRQFLPAPGARLQPEGVDHCGRGRAARLGLPLHDAALRARVRSRRRTARRRPDRRRQRRPDDQPAPSGTLGRVRRLGQAARRQGRAASSAAT